MKSSNPIFNNTNVVENVYSVSSVPMTVSGTMNKLFLLSFVMLLGAAAVFYQFSMGHFDFVNMIMIAGIIISFILAIIMRFKVSATPYLSPIYAFFQGAVLSGVSCFFEKMFSGIVMQAVTVTFFVVLTMAVAYKTQLIRATETFKKVMFLSTLSIGIFYLVSFALMLFGVNIPYFQNLATPAAILVNVIIAIFAALNLIIDFDFIEQGVNRNLPALYEWHGAFGLLVTIMWLYLEILRILARLANNKN